MQCTSDPCVCSLDGEARDYCFPTRVTVYGNGKVLGYYDIAQAIEDAAGG